MSLLLLLVFIGVVQEKWGDVVCSECLFSYNQSGDDLRCYSLQGVDDRLVFLGTSGGQLSR